MACGTPVVTTRAGSLPEVVGDDEEGGLLVPPKSPRALSQAIAKLLADDDLSQDLGRRARRRAERLFSWKRTAENTILVYQKLIGRRAAKQRAAVVKGTSPCLTTKTS
jgi:glycosyltransferase involved in cell wall biosynthesis